MTNRNLLICQPTRAAEHPGGPGERRERRGILLSVKRGDKRRRLLAEQAWADDADSVNATVPNDYRYWIDELNGLTPGFR